MSDLGSEVKGVYDYLPEHSQRAFPEAKNGHKIYLMHRPLSNGEENAQQWGGKVPKEVEAEE